LTFLASSSVSGLCVVWLSFLIADILSHAAVKCLVMQPADTVSAPSVNPEAFR